MVQEKDNKEDNKGGKGGGFLKNTVKMVSALAAVGVLSALALVYVYEYSLPKIQANEKKETQKAIESIFEGAKEVRDIKDNEIFSVKDASGALMGYAVIAEGNGYQGVIKLIAGIDAGLSTMKGMEVLGSQETPGLGAEIAGKAFRSQFAGLSITHDIEYVKNEEPDKPYEIKAIAGATISSRAVVTILNKKIQEIHKVLGDAR